MSSQRDLSHIETRLETHRPNEIVLDGAQRAAVAMVLAPDGDALQRDVFGELTLTLTLARARASTLALALALALLQPKL